jgi:hypothetical protein
VGDGPEGLVAIDFDGDGKIDIAASSLNQHNIALLQGNGDATFVPAIKPDATSPFGSATWHYPAYMAAADLNGDGKPELVTTHLFEAAAAVLRNTTPTPVQLVKVVSRKVHGSAGTFDVDLPLTGTPGIECRSGGASGDYTLVFSFLNTLASASGASVSSGTGTVSSSAIDSNDAHNYIVTLTGVINAQTITVSLTNVTDSIGNQSPALTGSMSVLLGDVNASGAVSNTDVASIKAQVAAPIDSSNFRNDVNANGVISNTDVSSTKALVGNTLP